MSGGVPREARGRLQEELRDVGLHVDVFVKASAFPGQRMDAVYLMCGFPNLGAFLVKLAQRGI